MSFFDPKNKQSWLQLVTFLGVVANGILTLIFGGQ